MKETTDTVNQVPSTEEAPEVSEPTNIEIPAQAEPESNVKSDSKQKKKGFQLIGVGLIGLALAISISATIQPQTTEPSTEVTLDQSIERAETLLQQYSEKGMNQLLALYPEQAQMEYALRTIGTVIPSHTFQTLDGKDYQVNASKTKTIYEVVQAGCSYCEQSVPFVQATEDVNVVPIFLNSTEEEIVAFYERIDQPVPETVLIDEEHFTVDTLGVQSTPTTFFVDEDGVVTLLRMSVHDETTFAADLELAFGEDRLIDEREGY